MPPIWTPQSTPKEAHLPLPGRVFCSPHLSVEFFFSMSHLPPAARFPPPPSTPRQQHTQRQHTQRQHTHRDHTHRDHTHRDNTHHTHTEITHTPRQHTQRSSSLHTETTRTETTHRDNTHTQRQHTPRRHRQRSHTQRSHTPEFVAGAALCEPPCSVRGCGCCVVCGCRRWSPVRPSIVIRVFTCLLTCRVRGRRSTL